MCVAHLDGQEAEVLERVGGRAAVGVGRRLHQRPARVQHVLNRIIESDRIIGSDRIISSNQIIEWDQIKSDQTIESDHQPI